MRIGTVLSVFAAAALMTGCEAKHTEPMQELPPEEYAPAQTPSTYTGTTVDFVYVSTAASQRRRGANEFDMPEFPAADNADDIFGDDFRRLFGSTVRVDDQEVTASAEDTAGSGLSETDMTQAAPVDGAFTEISISMADMPYGEMTVTAVNIIDAPYNKTDTAETLPPEFNAAAAESARTETAVGSFRYDYDIADYMPDSNEFPDFPYDEFNKIFN